MSLSRNELEQKLNQLFSPSEFNDYCPNGLQVEGSATVKKIITGVTASRQLIEKAIAQNADCIIVHHGFFWKGEDPCVLGMKHQRLKLLLQHNINLFAYHLPLDVHAAIGNNVQLAKLLNWQIDGGLEPNNPKSVGLVGHCQKQSVAELAAQLELRLGFKPLIIGNPQQLVTKLAWCTGAAQSYLSKAIDLDCQVFITGEISEPYVHQAMENNIVYLACGHHATETVGVKALAQYINQQWSITADFIDCPIPV